MGDIVINKQGLIFLTLTSLILVLSVYYVTMPTELLLTTNSLYNDKEEKEEVTSNEKIVVSKSNTISAMKNILNEERRNQVNELNNRLTNNDLSVEEKNNVYNELKVINKLESMEEDIEKMIKEEYKLDNFVKIKDDIIEITVNSKKHDKELAAKIMSSVEKKYNNMYISVSFKE